MYMSVVLANSQCVLSSRQKRILSRMDQLWRSCDSGGYLSDRSSWNIARSYGHRQRAETDKVWHGRVVHADDVNMSSHPVTYTWDRERSIERYLRTAAMFPVAWLTAPAPPARVEVCWVQATAQRMGTKCAEAGLAGAAEGIRRDKKRTYSTSGISRR